MLGFVDPPAGPVLLPVDLLLFTPRQRAAVEFAVGLDFLVDGGLPLFQPGRLSGVQLTLLNPVADALLLIGLPLADFALAVVLCGQLAAIQGAIVAHLFIDGGFLGFQVGRPARGDLARLDALRDAVLLVFGALMDRGKGKGVANPARILAAPVRLQ